MKSAGTILTILFSLLVAAAVAADAGGYPLVVTDDAGHDVRIAAKPERIVSLTMFTDDILIDLVDKSSIVAVTTFAADSAISNVTEQVADIPNKIAFNLEVVLDLDPDIVFVASWSEADKVTQLRRIGIPVFLIESALTVADIQTKIRTVAQVVGEPDAGEQLIDSMNHRLRAVAETVGRIPVNERKSVLDYAIWNTAQGRGTSWNEIVEKAGLVNAVGDLAVDEWGQVSVSKEKIIELNPDLLILPGWVYGDPAGAENFYMQITRDPALRTMDAITNGEVYMMPENLKSTTSHYIVDAVEFLSRTAYPELFE